MSRYNPEGRKMYKTQQWKNLRRFILDKYPVCTRCHSQPSTVVDHIKPHRFDPVLFFDINNLTALDASCHNSWKAKMENGRVDTACDDDGFPQDSSHPWNKPR